MRRDRSPAVRITGRGRTGHLRPAGATDGSTASSRTLDHRVKSRRAERLLFLSFTGSNRSVTAIWRARLVAEIRPFGVSRTIVFVHPIRA